MSDTIASPLWECRTVMYNSGIIIYQDGQPYPASTSFIAIKILSKMIKDAEQRNSIRDHEYSAGVLNCKGISKKYREDQEKTLVKGVDIQESNSSEIPSSSNENEFAELGDKNSKEISKLDNSRKVSLRK